MGTRANAHDGHERTWVEVERAIGGTNGGMRKLSSIGDILIIFYARSKDAWS